MKKIASLLILSFISLNIYSNVKLPQLFSDGIVLQRNKPIPVWGWADANEKIEVHFKNQIVKTKADKNGKWILKLKAEHAGGPFKLIIKGKNTITINNVLVGEVWICSGQSNMQFQVGASKNAKEELNDADYPMIRHFMVERNMSSQLKNDVPDTKWEIANKNTVANFTAVGYFFAKKVHKELNIPIGIIHSSWGGTNVETWISKIGFEKNDEFKQMINALHDVDILELTKKRTKIISDKVEKLQGSKIDPAKETSFHLTDFDDKKWPEMNAPELWENQDLGNLDGVVWMRKTVKISKEDAGKEAYIELSKIDDQDTTYINGIKVGTTRRYDEKRNYDIPAGVLKEGDNVIAIRIFDYAGGGGIYGDKEDLKLTTKNNVIPLSGQWKYNVASIRSEISPNSYPSLLYNAMINPLVPYAFQGVLWYQGETNVYRAQQYKKSFPLLISDWRSKWNQGDFPFYYVQLSSYDEFGGNSNDGSKWAELREAQTQTLQVPNTGMAVTTDIGNAKDIHPINKQDVGTRLAAIALHNVYKKNIVYSGPMYKSIEVKKDKIIITFEYIGSGLMTTDKYGYVKGFEVAGEDKKFYYAKAYIENDKIIISSENVPNPVAVHYGWADDAGDCNLYNKEGFPASPFRSDTWKTVTEDDVYKF